MFGLLPFFNRSKGAEAKPVLSDEGAMLVQQAGGTHYHQSKQRKVYTAAMAAAGAVLPIFSGTTQQFGLLNGLGSGVIANIIEIALTYVDTTGAAGGYVIGVIKDAGADKATGGNITSYTELTAYEALTTGKAADPRCRALTAFGCTAPVVLRHLGINQTVLTAATTSMPTFETKARFDGDLCVAPGTAICVAGNIATLSKWACSITWAEEPV